MSFDPHLPPAPVVFPHACSPLSGLDNPGVFFSDNFGSSGDPSEAGAGESNLALKKRFKEFLRQFLDDGGFDYRYRDGLRRNYNMRQYWVEVAVEDLVRFAGISR